MESHHSCKRLAPCGLEDIDLPIPVFAAKSDVIAPIKMYLNGTTASTNATPVITHITLSVCCNIKENTNKDKLSHLDNVFLPVLYHLSKCGNVNMTGLCARWTR